MKYIVFLMLAFPVHAFVVSTDGGNNGQVYHVTNLNPTGDGSLEKCISASGPRICVFDVAGTISLGYHLYVRNPNLTIAGETAPYPGISIKDGGIYIAASDVIVRHITIMRGDDYANKGASISVRAGSHSSSGVTERVIIDHCSLYWGTDETVTIWSPSIRDVVISNSIIAETLLPHATGMIIGAGSHNIAVINNLFISNTHRNPAFGNNTSVFIGGNLIYNHSDKAIHTEPESETTPIKATIVDNLVIFGPDIVNTDHVLWLKPETREGSSIFMANNHHPSCGRDQINLVRDETDWGFGLSCGFYWYGDYEPVPVAGLEEYLQNNVGANPENRHQLDQRILYELHTRTGGLKDCVAQSEGCERSVGGWPPML